MSDIRDDEVHKVTRIEFHLLLTCPCLECQQERRKRRKHAVMPPDAARALGYLKINRPNAGSVAREEAMKVS